MMATYHDDEFVQYVLGLLPDEARERLDEASITDDEVAARLRAAETNLIDNYVRGQLSGATLERFESYYLSSPRRRENVRLAADFLGAVDRSVTRSEPVTWTTRMVSSGFARLAAAATLAIVIGGAILYQSGQPRTQLAQATPESQPVQSRSSQTLAPPPAPPAPGTTAGTTPVPARIVAVVLPPPTRSVAPVPTVTVPAGVDRVRFELQLEANDFRSYRVGLQDPVTSQILWQSDWIVPQTSADQASVPVVVPANLLTPRHYSLDLSGRDANGRAEVIGSYAVRVVQP